MTTTAADEERPQSRPVPLAGRVAIVTGASRGIGAATARAFANAGAAVVLAARDKDALESVERGISSAGGRALPMPTDVGDPASVERMVAGTVAEFGRLDVAFNNAAGGGQAPTPLAELPVEAYDSALAISLRGVFLSMKFEIPAMLNAGGGAIVNMSSTAGLEAVAGARRIRVEQARCDRADTVRGTRLRGTRGPRQRPSTRADPHQAARGGGRGGAASSRYGDADAADRPPRGGRRGSRLAVL